MLTSLLLMMTPVIAIEADPPAKLILFANEKFYQNQKGKEQEFVGTLKMIKRPGGVVGFGRFNPFYLVMKNDKREVYVGGKQKVLLPYVGKRVQFVGKPVDLRVEGQNHREIWPASVVVLPDDKGVGEPKDGSLKIIGRARWRASGRPGSKRQQLVIRSEKELTAKVGPINPKGAVEGLTRQFKVDKIDFDKQMIVVATAGAQRTGGYRMEIVELLPGAKTLTVKWKLHTPKPGTAVTQAFTHPAEAVLVPKFDGKVVFEVATDKKKR